MRRCCGSCNCHESQNPLGTMTDLFVKAVRLKRNRVPSFHEYPFTIAASRRLDEVRFRSLVSFFIGENGTGKSTLLEAIITKGEFDELKRTVEELQRAIPA